MWALLGLAAASIPFPDYRDQLVQSTWFEVNSLLEAACDAPGFATCNPEPLDEAITKATAFQRHVTPDARLEYLIGLAWISRGEPAKGERALRAALALDVDRADAWHDLGELTLNQGRLDEAEEAFGHVDRLVPDGPRGWLGPWRLAEVAARRRDPVVFERQMKEALRRGFSFTLIQGRENWREFAADPAIGPVVRKLVTVYGTPDVLQSLEPRP